MMEASGVGSYNVGLANWQKAVLREQTNESVPNSKPGLVAMECRHQL
ncbi:hypothetical protein EC9_29670 [Rosistilla ulvae]|uniref:Uncharacterized protein n=1 Tax=Rosistilla ulvae TaxID=1930277 RepID=A0A517M1M0_9BACT|nr:hypothetical protein EC9_29670 [Rosistilla ulvae]